MLLGRYEHNLDDKQRLTIPSKLRNKLGEKIYISKGFDGCLEIRSEENFQKWYNEILTHTSTSSSSRLFMREILPNSSELEFDNAGRIKIPSNLLDLSNIKKNVSILGMGDKMEIWDTEFFNEWENKHSSEFEEAAEKIGGVK